VENKGTTRRNVDIKVLREGRDIIGCPFYRRKNICRRRRCVLGLLKNICRP
jgi:hypothetical protein